jgi:hypothetical protein
MNTANSGNTAVGFWAAEKTTIFKWALIALAVSGTVIAALVLLQSRSHAMPTCSLVKDIQAFRNQNKTHAMDITNLLVERYPEGMRREEAVDSLTECGFKVYSYPGKSGRGSKEEKLVALTYIHDAASVFDDEVRIVVKFANDHVSAIVGQATSHRL